MRLALPAEVCTTLVSLSSDDGGANAVPLEACGEALGRIGDQIRTLMSDPGPTSALSREDAHKLLVTLAGVQAAASLVELEGRR